ncbi:MAG: hypothetical protein RM368_18560 [Nostoc sp. DedSLP03]|uniref:hypothetical protein n=1 Tax=Nostoc sp. DedSLP03 TaxID=3075400 RepID=UPI002AD31EEF|nr:hypothetical protein [Nostoc sp. DedSLP03]MDZ7966946.1 hypothetical protein [Nostoc sp. DedSLP03]
MKRGRFFTVRDRFGIKPLFYTTVGNTLYLSSRRFWMKGFTIRTYATGTGDLSILVHMYCMTDTTRRCCCRRIIFTI